MQLLIENPSDLRLAPLESPNPAFQQQQTMKDASRWSSSESSHSGLFFIAPQSPSLTTTNIDSESTSDRSSLTSSSIVSLDESVCTVHPKTSKAPSSGNEVVPQLAHVTKHLIGPFPRVKSPAQLLPLSESPSPPVLPPLSSADKLAAANQHFVMVEVHQANSEPDVNEIRALPHPRGKHHCAGMMAIHLYSQRMKHSSYHTAHLLSKIFRDKIHCKAKGDRKNGICG